MASPTKLDASCEFKRITSMAPEIEDEILEEEPKPFSWPFKSEEDEHRYFDDLQRARDIRSA